MLIEFFRDIAKDVKTRNAVATATYISRSAVRSHQPDRDERLRSAIDKLNQMMPEHPNIIHVLQANLGDCYVALSERLAALPHYEKAVMAYPNPNNMEAFHSYVDVYLNCTREISHHAINDLGVGGKHRKEAIPRLEEVVKSTGRISQRYPQLDIVIHENQAALAWLRSVGARTLDVTRLTSN